ncbi:MAG: sigma-70 family RNA polymerase sigma factor [Actinobacteria bacterium]|jgi:RNA polymerase sigma factor (sigma-70 family)|nr:MAG: sigma-70 family RNA polymerase sigma factor [Actinomycetota bacterium]
MRDRDVLAKRFEEQRPQLRRIAYRMLGTVDEADDAVQEAWIRLSRTDDSSVENLGAWLTTVVSRVCLDMLRTRRSRREDFVGSWMPEPIVAVGEEPSPEDEALIADGVGIALYVVLETLSPAERLAFVLHDMFAMPFDQIARIAGRTPEAVRQLASRARRRVQAANAEPDVELSEQRRVVDAFLEAARKGDFDALLELLDPEVTLRVDAGPGSPLAQEPIAGAEAVLTEARRWNAFARHSRPATVNGVAGAVVARPGQPPFTVIAFTVANGRVTAIDFVVDPAKLARISA